MIAGSPAAPRPLSAFLATAIALFALTGSAEVSAPPELAKVDVVERLGQRIPAEIPLRDSEGRSVVFGDYLKSGRPIVLTLSYFECPMLCSLVLNGVVRGVLAGELRVGIDVDLITVSIEPGDLPELAAEKRRHYLQALGLSDREARWPFLTGQESAIAALADSVGFVYSRIPHTSEFAHAAVVFVLTPSGVVSRYLYGTELSGRGLRLSVAEAAEGRAARSFDRFLLHCYRYDPATRRYGLYIKGFLQTGGLLVLGALTALLVRLWRRDVRKYRTS